MPLFMDRHEVPGATAVDLAAAHLKDLEIQDRYGVEYLNYWFDHDRQRGFCLVKGPDAQAVDAVHRESHGTVANQIIEVDEALVARFMGGITEHAAGEAYVETAFRAILFTDLEGSTTLTQRLGDAGAMAVLRRHDEIVRDALRKTSGTEVKHTGDGVMASFRSVARAIEAAVLIQRGLAEAEHAAGMPLAVRIGIAAGEPVTEGDDLFGTAVQLASRLCNRATPRSIVVASSVRDLAIGKGFRFGAARAVRLKGFDEPIRASEVIWQSPEGDENGSRAGVPAQMQ
jgi:class 3 adenylate cyclase